MCSYLTGIGPLLFAGAGAGPTGPGVSEGAVMLPPSEEPLLFDPLVGTGGVPVGVI